MRIALVYPFQKRWYFGCYPPISLLYIASYLEAHGHDIAVFDIDEDNQSITDLAKKVGRFEPMLLGLPLFTFGLKDMTFILQEIIKYCHSECKIVLGGPHATVSSEDIFNLYPKIHFVLSGEAEINMLNLAETLEKGQALSQINGLSYRLGDTIAHNKKGPSIRDINVLPFPARHLLLGAYKKQTYWRVGHRGTTDVIITSRGCPFQCNFCFKVSKEYRWRSSENILEELINIRSMGTKSVHIMDDLFTANKERAIETLSLIKKEKLGMEFKVRARVDSVDSELLASLKEAGVKSVVLGVESGSQTMLDQMNKRTSVTKNKEAISLVKSHGLQCYADLFIGYPGETRESIEETKKLLIQSRPTAANIQILYPLPGTKVYEESKEKNTLMGDWSLEGDPPWVKLPWIKDKEDLYKLRRNLQRSYMLRPSVLLTILFHWFRSLDIRQIKAILKYFFKVITEAKEY